MQAQLVRDLPATPSTKVPVVDGVVPKGTVIEGRACRPWFYVQMGAAIPLDDECRMAAGLTDDQIELQVKLYEAKLAGIQPEDMAAWKANAMTGYDENGEWIPGPEYSAWRAKFGSSSIYLPGGNEDECEDDE